MWCAIRSWEIVVYNIAVEECDVRFCHGGYVVIDTSSGAKFIVICMDCLQETLIYNQFEGQNVLHGK